MLALLAMGALAAPLASWSRQAVPGATGFIAAVPSQANTYTFRLTNTGEEPIQCMRFVGPTGVNFVSVNPVPGSQIAPISGQGFSALLNPPLTSDGILAWTFTTAGPYPANGGGTLAVSADCKTDFTGTVTGPSTTTVPGQTEPSSTPANTVTTALTCKCDKLAVSIKTSDLYAAAAQLVPERDALARIGALVSWTLTCSAGGGNCTGRIAALPPPKSDAKVKVFTPSTIVPKTGPYKGKTLFRKGRETPPTIECNGPCNASRTGKFFLQVDSANDLLPATRARETIVLRFEIKCMTTSTQKIKLVFKANGDLDRPKSTLTK